MDDWEGTVWRYLKQPGERTREAVITSHHRLVRQTIQRVLKRRNRPGITEDDREDLFQEGIYGLIHALGKYDPSRRTRFSTYAASWIFQRVTRALDNNEPIRRPAHVVEAVRYLSHVNACLEERLGRRPTQSDIAQELGLSLEFVQDLAQACSARPVASYDIAVGGDEDELWQELFAGQADSDPGLAVDGHLVEFWQIETVLPELEESQRYIIERHYFQHLSLSEIGQSWPYGRKSITREAARQKLKKAMQAIQAKLELELTDNHSSCTRSTPPAASSEPEAVNISFFIEAYQAWKERGRRPAPQLLPPPAPKDGKRRKKKAPELA